MAGAYLEFFPQDSYTLTSNVLLANVAQELYQSAVYFSAFSDSWEIINAAPVINVSTVSGGVAISNNNTNTNSLITVTLNTALTANLAFVNSGFWSLVVKNASNQVYTVDQGRFAVTRRPGIQYYP